MHFEEQALLTSWKDVDDSSTNLHTFSWAECALSEWSARKWPAGLWKYKLKFFIRSAVNEIWSNKWNISFQRGYIILMQLLLSWAHGHLDICALEKQFFLWNGICGGPFNKALWTPIKHCSLSWAMPLYLKALEEHTMTDNAKWKQTSWMKGSTSACYFRLNEINGSVHPN